MMRPTQKYQALARDAHVSGDRVGAENFLQHSEHYSRILIAAQESAQERQGQHNGHNNNNGGQHNNGNQGQSGGGQSGQNEGHTPQQDGQSNHSSGQSTQSGAQDGHSNRRDDQPDTSRSAPRQAPSDGLAEIDAAQGQPDLVDTPEGKPKPKPKPRTPRPRRPRTPKVAAGDAAPDGTATPADAAE